MKLIAIASVGGHWIQLLRVTLALEELEIIFVSTKESFRTTVPEHQYYTVPDASRWDKFKLVLVFWQVLKIIRREKPKAILTTGAAPGLMGLFAGKILGVRTIWLDSIANAEKLSLSGRIATYFADRVYTQWPDLTDSRVFYAGNVLL